MNAIKHFILMQVNGLENSKFTRPDSYRNIDMGALQFSCTLSLDNLYAFVMH